MDIFLIKFFVALRRTEAITWENFVPAKWDPGSTKAGSRLAGMKLFPCNHRIKFMKSLLYCRDPGKAGQNFIPAKRDHVITPLKGFGDSALYMARVSEPGCTGEIVHLAENEKFAPIYTIFPGVSSFQKRQG